MRKTRFTATLLAIVGVTMGLLLVGCGRDDALADHTSQWMETGERVLSEALMSYFTNPVYDTEWDLENAETTVDDESFPAWARDRYDVCIHWTVPFWTEIYNTDRRPGNSSVFIQQPAEGWGWILVSDRGTYILELGYQYLDDDIKPVLFIDAWDIST
jgi:hypothetical protein